MMKRRLFVILVALLLAIAMLEAVLRFGVGLGDPPLARLDPETEYEHVGPAEYRRWGNRVSINAVGMRMPPIDVIPRGNALRILLVGDSVVYGNHFLDQSETISARMTMALREMPHLEGCDPVVLPAAVSSWGPVNQAAFLAREGTFGADSVGIIVSAHDLYDVPRHGTSIVPYRTSAPVGAIGDAVEAVLERVFPKTVTSPPQPAEIRADQTLAALADMVTQFQRHGVSPILFYHPTILERENALRPEAAIFETWARSNSVRFVNLESVPVRQDDYRDDIHPNADGAKKLSIALVEHLAMTLSCA